MRNSIGRNAYRAQISEWAGQFARGITPRSAGMLEPGSSPRQVEEFVDENRHKRCEKIAAFCGLVAEACEDMPAALDRYIAAVAARDGQPARADAVRFLEWLAAHESLDAEQRDCVQCERSRLMVEELARRDRFAYLRFAELRSVLDEQLRLLEDEGRGTLVLNPAHFWNVLWSRRFLDSETPLPAPVVFYAADEELRTCVLTSEGRDVFHRIERLSRGGFDDLEESLPDSSRDELLEHCRDLAKLGLLAIA